MNAFRCAVLLGLGVAIGLLGALLLRGTEAQPVFAGTANHAGNIVGVTGKSARGDIDVLWVIDAEKKHLAAYQYGSRGVEFLGARKIWYDLELISYRDASDPEVQLPKLRELWKKANLKPPEDEKIPSVTPDAGGDGFQD